MLKLSNAAWKNKDVTGGLMLSAWERRQRPAAGVLHPSQAGWVPVWDKGIWSGAWTPPPLQRPSSYTVQWALMHCGEQLEHDCLVQWKERSGCPYVWEIFRNDITRYIPHDIVVIILLPLYDKINHLQYFLDERRPLIIASISVIGFRNCTWT